MTNKIKGLKELREFGYGNPSVKIAVLDGFLDLNHRCFNRVDGKLMPFSLAVQPSSSGLALKHGTAVCSLIFGKPGSEVEGVAPGCSGIIIPIYSEDNMGNFSSASQVLLARAIEIAIDQKANIINISGGQLSVTGDPEIFLKQAIEKCYKKGILIVAATGNEGCNCLHVPAAHKFVLAVGSMDEHEEPTPETNFGISYQVNGLLAPGKNLTAALPGGGTFTTSGATSYATPIVSGVVALLMSVQLNRGYPPDPYIIRSILEKTAIPCISNGNNDCRRFMRGKLNLPGVIELIKKNPEILASGFHNKLTKKYTAMESNFFNKNAKSSVTNDVMAVEPSCNHNHDNHEIHDHKDSDEPDEPDQKRKKFLEHEKLTYSSDSVVNSAGKTLPEINPSEINVNTNMPEKQKPLYNYNQLKSGKMENAITSQNRKLVNSNMANSALPVKSSANIDPSDCGCGCGGAGGKVVATGPVIVYALGTIGYDFGSESHRDSFIQSMGDGRNPHNSADLITYLRDNPWAASELLWTLNIDATPIYALYATGPYSNVVFERILNSLEEQQNGNIQRISVPGIAEGTTSLLNGQTVVNLYPNLRGMYSWTTAALVASTAAGERGENRVLAENVTNFLNRVYYEMRNLGVTAEERAVNYAATNAFQVSGVFASALRENLELSDIDVIKSPICRPGADCYDVILRFFNPRERLTQAARQYRFTVDVSDVVPVTVGEIRSWSVFS